MMKRYLIFIFFGILFGCEIDEPLDQFPFGMESTVSFDAQNGYRLKTTLEEIPNDIISYGFQGKEFEDEIQEKLESNSFSRFYKLQFLKGVNYSVRSFVRTPNEIIYGPYAHFLAEYSLKPIIEEVSSQEVFIGQEITLTGKNFNENHQLFFEESEEEIDFSLVNSSKITFIIPARFKAVGSSSLVFKSEDWEVFSDFEIKYKTFSIDASAQYINQDLWSSFDIVGLCQDCNLRFELYEGLIQSGKEGVALENFELSDIGVQIQIDADLDPGKTYFIKFSRGDEFLRSGELYSPLSAMESIQIFDEEPRQHEILISGDYLDEVDPVLRDVNGNQIYLNPSDIIERTDDFIRFYFPLSRYQTNYNLNLSRNFFFTVGIEDRMKNLVIGYSDELFELNYTSNFEQLENPIDLELNTSSDPSVIELLENYFVYGLNQDSNESEIWIYNLSTQSWTESAPFPGLIGRSMFSFNDGVNYVYVGAGIEVSKNEREQEFYRYNIAADYWEKMSSLPKHTYSYDFEPDKPEDIYNLEVSQAIMYKDKGVVLTNLSYDFINVTHVYQPESDSWTKIQEEQLYLESRSSFLEYENDLFYLRGSQSSGVEAKFDFDLGFVVSQRDEFSPVQFELDVFKNALILDGIPVQIYEIYDLINIGEYQLGFESRVFDYQGIQNDKEILLVINGAYLYSFKPDSILF